MLRAANPPRLRPFGSRLLSTSHTTLHENPLGLPRNTDRPAPTLPRRGGLPSKRGIPHVKRVVLVASGKGGVGKSTVAVNLAFALAMRQGRPRVGVLDLDVFGPSVPKLMGLDGEDAQEPLLTPAGALVPLSNHGLPCMSMGFLLGPGRESEGKAVVWRGLMVQKAVQQLLFDVDWRAPLSPERPNETDGPGLDVLVVDMPPGTGDVPLTLGQLVNVDGAVVVSTPQDVALADVRKGIAMFRKVGVPITGLVLNQSHFFCPSCDTPHELYGSAERFTSVANQLGARVLGQLPLVPGVSTSGDGGRPYALVGGGAAEGKGAEMWKSEIGKVADAVWESLRLQ